MDAVCPVGDALENSGQPYSMAFRDFFKPPPPDPIPVFGEPPIPLEDLRDLFAWLARPKAPTCTHAHKDTIRFLLDRDLPVEPVLKWLRAGGGHCDCKVVNEVAGKWK